MGKLVGGTAVVTGGGSGIGRAIALALAAEGARVGVVDISRQGGEVTVAEIADRQGEATFIQADVSRWEEVDRAVGEAVAQLGPLGIMVNAAGILDAYAVADSADIWLWDKVIGINLTGTFYGCRRALAEMLPAGRGRIVNISSAAGLVGDGGGSAYIASKHGVVGLTRHLGVQFAARGITVNAICPGPIGTNLRASSMDVLGSNAPDMMKVGIAASEEALRAVIPMGRRGTVEEIAHAACFLASEEAGYMTGTMLVIDGGWTAK